MTATFLCAACLCLLCGLRDQCAIKLRDQASLCLQVACEEARSVEERIFALQLLTGQVTPQVRTAAGLEVLCFALGTIVSFLHASRLVARHNAQPGGEGQNIFLTGCIGVIVQVAKLSPREVIACLPLPSRVQFPSRDALREQFVPARHGPFPLKMAWQLQQMHLLSNIKYAGSDTSQRSGQERKGSEELLSNLF